MWDAILKLQPRLPWISGFTITIMIFHYNDVVPIIRLLVQQPSIPHKAASHLFAQLLVQAELKKIILTGK